MYTMPSPRDAGVNCPHDSDFEEYASKLDQLSAREREVVELAVTGRTDEQISQGLGITISTVNSYWVRIRGKVGQLGRTEIVADFLRHQTRQEHFALQSENRILRHNMTAAQEELHELKTLNCASSGSEWLSTALLHLPAAIFVTGPPANVLFANRAAKLLYAASAQQLEGMPMHELSTSSTPETAREPCRELFREGGPDRVSAGIEEPYYAKRPNGSNFRAFLRAERFSTPSGHLAIVIVSEFLADLDTVLESLRMPLQTS